MEDINQPVGAYRRKDMQRPHGREQRWHAMQMNVETIQVEHGRDFFVKARVNEALDSFTHTQVADVNIDERIQKI